MSKIDYDKLKKIEKPFGLLDEETRTGLVEACGRNRGDDTNINIVNANGKWESCTPMWDWGLTYRLDPAWEPPDDEPKREMVVCEVHQPVTRKGSVHFFLGSYSYDAIMFCERENVPGYAGVRYEGMREGEFMIGKALYIDGDGERWHTATRELLESGELRPAKPLEVAFVKEAK